MLNRLPRWTPPLADMLADIGQPRPAALAAALNVHTRTAQTWLAHNNAPRPAMLTIWWLTRWGMSTLDSEYGRTIDMLYLRATAAEQECARLRREVARIVALGDFGAANTPTMDDLSIGRDAIGSAPL